jgi:quercetin dioxygenase-like cupin family protein
VNQVTYVTEFTGLLRYDGVVGYYCIPKRRSVIMKKVQIMKLPSIFKKEGIEARKIYDKESALANVITIQPGFELPAHVTPVDVFMLVLEGKGVFTVGDESLELEKYELIEGPKNVPHGIKNTGDEPLMVLVLKAPRP